MSCDLCPAWCCLLLCPVCCCLLFVVALCALSVPCLIFYSQLTISSPAPTPAPVHIWQALTRKFKLGRDVDLPAVVAQTPLAFTGADFYALCSSALSSAIVRVTSGLQQLAIDASSGGTTVTVEALLERLTEDDVTPVVCCLCWPPVALLYLASSHALLPCVVSCMPRVNSGCCTSVLRLQPDHGMACCPSLQVTQRDLVEAARTVVPSVSAQEVQAYEELRARFCRT